MDRKPTIPRIVELLGGPRERGQAYGETCRAWIAEVIEQWKDSLVALLHEDPVDYIARLLQDTDFLPAVERHTPRVLDELRGLAEGAKQPLLTMFAFQLPDEQWWHARDFPLDDDGWCSALGVGRQGDIPPMVAQNQDLGGFFSSHPLLLHIQDGQAGLESYVVTYAGLIGIMGLNRHGVALCENTLLQLDHNLRGVPVLFVSRGILEQRSLAEATAFCRSVPHASGQNYVIGGKDGVVDLECSGGGVVEYAPHTESDRLAHTNHPFVNHDTAQFDAAVARMSSEGQVYWRQGLNTHRRFESVEKRLMAADRVTLDTITGILRAHDDEEYPVCRHNRNGYTSSSAVMELGDSPRLHFTFGPPCMNEYYTLEFR